MTDKERKLDKLRKLHALASNNPNEKEAEAAIAKLRALQVEYGLTREDIESGSEETKAFGSKAKFSGEKNFGWCDRFLWRDIARFTSTLVGTGRDEDGDLTLIYFGHEVDVELAWWLRDTIKAAMAFHWGVHRDFVLNGKFKAEDVRAFHIAMASRLRERMAVAVRTAPPTGQSLIVLKDALVRQKGLEAGFQEARGGRGYSADTNSASYRAGYEAGGYVNIGRSVNSRTGLKIGKA